MRTSFITDRAEIDDIISGCEQCFVGIIEEDGSPYVFPMSFGYDGSVIILHSGPHGKHLSLLEKDNRVCITFCTENNPVKYQHPNVACSYSVESKSVLCKGRIEFVEDLEEKHRLMNILMKHYTNCDDFKMSTPAIKNVKVWIMEPKEITAKAFGQKFKY